MRLAVVGWAADSGVGRELIDATRNLPVACAFVLQNQAKPNRLDLLRGTPLYAAHPVNLAKQMELFIECHKPTTVLTWETPGDWTFPDVWQRKGIRWVHMTHWDWFSDKHKSVWQKGILLAPNQMCKHELKKNYDLDAIHLPVPVDTDRLQFRPRTKADLFISVYGYGGMRDRRSLPEIFEAWRRIANPPQLVIRAQVQPDELKRLQVPPGIKIDVNNVPEPSALYDTGDIALQPSRYEGVGVSMIEAQARGVPVIAINAPPMNEVAPDLLVPVANESKVALMGKALPCYTPSIDGIVERVTALRGTDITALSQKVRDRVEREGSWKALRGRWIEVLGG